MHYSGIFSLRPGPTRAVFLPAIPVEGLGPDDLPGLRQRVYGLIEEKLIGYGASWIERV
jgi:1-acyl-sn-glycerol-3-phosphate acyltransferase